MTQDAREATIDLLFLSLYLDNHLSLLEDESLSEALDSLGWESDLPRERFIFGAFSRARATYADEAKIEEFLQSHAETIKIGGASGDALTWLYRVIAADGITSSEKRFLDRVEKKLYA